jgi:hypothetical protein
MRDRPLNKIESRLQPSTVEVLWENPSLRISLEKESQILICEWMGSQTLESIQSGGAIILQKLSEKRVTAVLNDNSSVQKQWEEAVDWTTNNWFPAMRSAGLRNFAWLLSKDIFARVSAKRAGESLPFVRYFHSYNEAYNWLCQIR